MWILRSARLLALVFLGSLLVALPVAAQETSALPLTATFTSDDGSFSFQYPGDWVVEERGDVAVLATNDAALDANQPRRGDLRATLIALPTDALPGLEADAPLEAVMAVATTQIEQDENCDPYSVPERLEIDGRRALRAGQTCSGMENALMVVDLGDESVGIVGAATRAGGMDAFADTLEAVAGSIEFTMPEAQPSEAETASNSPSELPDSFTNNSGTIALNYPDGWLVEESSEGVIAITDGEESILPNPIPGQLAAYIMVSEVPDAASLTLPEMLRSVLAQTPDPTAYSDVETFSVGDYQAVRAHLADASAESMVLIVDMGNNIYAVVDLYHLRGRLKSFEPMIYTILASLRYDAAGASSTSNTGAESQASDVSTDDLAELDGTFINDDETLSFQYPEDWFVTEQSTQGQSFWVVSPTQDIGNGPTGDSPYLIVQVVDLTSQESGSLPSDPDQRAIATLDLMRQQAGVEFNDPQTFSLNGEVVGQMDLVTNQIESRALLRYLSDNRFVIVHAFTAPGELEDLMPTLLAMVNSITNDPQTAVEQAESQLNDQQVEVQPTIEPTIEPTPIPAEPLSLDLEETYTSDDGTLTLHYPTGWTLDNSQSLLTLQNVEELDVESGDSGLEVVRGEYRVIMGVKPSDGEALEAIFSRETADAQVGDVETLTIGDHNAIGAPIDLRVMSGTLYVVDLGNDQVLIVTAIHAPGERATLEPLVSELVKSLELNTPA